MANSYKITKDGYIVSKKDKKIVDQLREKLTVTPEKKTDYGGELESFTVYRENNNNLAIPRYYGLKYLGPAKNLIKEENTKVNFEFQGNLRGTQVEVAKVALEKIKNIGGGILQLHTGYGKTVLALYLTSVLKVKALILVHKTFLMDQWYDRIKKFTNANVGIIRQKKTDVEGKDIVIGMLQSVSMIDYDPEIFKGFGLLLVDECFPGYTKVITQKGLFQIKDLYKMWKNGKELPLIKSYNEKNCNFEFKKMTYGWKKYCTQLIRIDICNKSFECTPNHKFLTTEGYIEARLLTNNHILFGNDGNNYKITSVSEVIISEGNNVYDIEVEDNHNFIIVDDDVQPVVHNCHHIGSKVFSRALLKISPQYTIGLSATPIRNDGMTKVIRWFLGDIMVKVERIGDNAVYIKSFEYECNDPLFVEKKRWVKGKVSPDTVKMTSNLCKIKSRNVFITNIVNALRKKDERKILVLSGRLDHLEILKKLLDAKIQEDIKDGICEEDEYKTAFYIGGMKDYELDDAASADILFGTYAMAEEGLDIDSLNTLVLASPKKDIVQAIGRIMRKPIEEGDINPLVIDIRDMLSCFEYWGTTRNKYYKTKRYNVHTLKAKNDNVVSFNDFMLNEGIIKEINSDIDIRKEYIIKKFGQDEYDFEKEVDFYSYPDEMFNYSTNYSEIFEINHIFVEGDKNEKKVCIDYDPSND
ncbi:superfamily II DNA or RNA helicase [Indivirus ILV1]|uniref:Superfamily II DNA or RNA helicase n=1 Tax=Indivirus ILV1 TaxID=1977633 RepID=A0A1V0SE84_9VIRU|nr:superfamily II DNA or RNA helicase [Indivirus ILV1]